jgi:hypothetical protein
MAILIFDKRKLFKQTAKIGIRLQAVGLGGFNQTKEAIGGVRPIGCSGNEIRGQVESAGINRHRVGDERALHERRSCSIMAPSHASATREGAAKR